MNDKNELDVADAFVQPLINSGEKAEGHFKRLMLA